MRKNLSIFTSGLLFSVGLFISGMTNPAKVFAFLDVTGNWDPSLAWVMVGAIIPTFFLYRFSFQRKKPLFSDGFDIQTKRQIDHPLIVGSVLFGIGWGLSGICPGPGIANIMAGRFDFVIFGIAMLAGMLLVRRV